MPKERIVGYDVLKTLAIFGVVLYHFGRVNFGTFNAAGVYYPNVTKVFYELLACSVPLFFMVNGALLADKTVGGGQNIEIYYTLDFLPYSFLFDIISFIGSKRSTTSKLVNSITQHGI